MTATIVVAHNLVFIIWDVIWKDVQIVVDNYLCVTVKRMIGRYEETNKYDNIRQMGKRR